MNSVKKINIEYLVFYETIFVIISQIHVIQEPFPSFIILIGAFLLIREKVLPFFYISNCKCLRDLEFFVHAQYKN